VAIALSGLVGVLTAIPAVRLRDFAFGMITLALPVIAVPLAVREAGVTGGSEGTVVTTAHAPSWSGLGDDQWRYYVVVVVAAVVFLLVRNLLHGRIGRALHYVRTNETVARAMGVPVKSYKVMAFTVAAVCGGIAGWLYLIAVQFISPDSLQLTLSISMLASLVVGGVRSKLGVLIGGAFYVLVPDVTDKITPGRSYLVEGIILLAVLIFFRGGIAGVLRLAADRVASALVGAGDGHRHNKT
jgi:branched-chain amino acid transport system permease protein